MKICLVSNYLPFYHSTWGGAEQACFHLLKALKEVNLDVSVITNRTEKESKDYKLVIFKRDGEKNIYGKIISRLLQPDYYNFLFLAELRKLIKEIQPDLIHLQNFSSFSLSIIKAAKTFNLPVCLSIYDYWPICPNGLLMYNFKSSCKKFRGLWCKACFKYVPLGNYSFRQALFSLWYKRYLKLIDQFIVLSANSQQILELYGIKKEKISIIPLPLYEENALTLDVQENLILFVGWLSFNKGLHIIIKALPRILREFPSVQLWVAQTGDIPSYKQEIQDLIDKMELGRAVRFLGKLAPQELKKILSRSCLVVIPEQWQNPSPLILSEAINFARPVVASCIGAMPEIITVKEFLAKHDDSDDFAGKIIWVLKNREEAFNLAESLRLKASELFNPAVNVAKLISLYKRLIG